MEMLEANATVGLVLVGSVSKDLQGQEWLPHVLLGTDVTLMYPVG